MSETKFTKGPWIFKMGNKRNFEHEYMVTCKSKLISASMSKLPKVELKANARLIAKAPDMYEMLENLANCDEFQMHKKEINDLLAEIRGEL